jgi:hypothetical protein
VNALFPTATLGHAGGRTPGAIHGRVQAAVSRTAAGLPIATFQSNAGTGLL